jgi:hypothetical protein
MNDDASLANPQATPPRPRLCFTVGLIGQHHATPSQALDRAADLFDEVRSGIEAINPQPWFRPGRTDLRVLASLSTDTERQLVDRAVTAGYPLGIVQSVGAAGPDQAVEYHLELHCKSACNDTADALPRAAVVAHSSLIIAVWDGSGRCGAAEAVARAVAAGVPVIHVPIDPAEPVRLLWSGFTALTPMQSDFGVATAEPCTTAALAALLEAIILPPDDPNERAQLRQYLEEPFHIRNLRIGYPVLLAMTGTQELRQKAWNKRLYPPEIKTEWGRFKAMGGNYAIGNAAMMASLEESFLWSNHLGSHFAQTMRSALVINFSFSALAVLTALAGLITTSFKLPLALLEIFIIAAIILNTRRGSQQEWQRRWLDYRSIAERLRPFRSLKLLGIAGQPRRVERKGTSPRRWIDWYVAAIWREMGIPQGTIDASQIDQLRTLVAEAELPGEIAYHRSNARRMRHLEDRLHLIGDAAFIATLLVCTLFPILYLGTYQLAMAWSTGFVILSAGLPAIGGAIYALRVHGDYGGAAGRSLETAAALDRIRSAILAPDVGLAQAGNLTTAAARVMLVDLDEWQLTYAQRSLAIPS